jgi:chitodextrinase
VSRRDASSRSIPLAVLCLLAVLALNAGASSAAVGGASSSAAASGLVAAYSFDATSGSALADSSGNANNGTVSGPTWSTGHTGGALSFDGVNDWVTVADSASLDLTTGMTLEAWVYPTAAATWRTVATKETAGNLEYGLFGNSDTGRPAGIMTIGASATQQITRGTAGLASAAWTHLATTYDGTRLRLFANGSQVSSRAASGAIGTSSNPLRIGGNSIWSEWFSGKIDDLRIYNRALSAAELKTDMNTPVGTIGTSGDTTAPTAPTGLTRTGSTATSISVSWTASTDDVGVAGYGRYQNGALASSGTSTSYTFSGLSCGTTYTLAVDAYDAAANRSAMASLSAATNACADTQAPTAPSALAASGATQTSITLGWNASSDNVGVAGYGRYLNATLVASGTATSYTFTGLACGTTYTLGADAFDAAGNRSSTSSLSASTSACPAADSQPPSVPQGQRFTGTTQSSISMAWNASTDNVGVAGYRTYLNNVLVATTTQLSYTYTGLQCGTTYTVALEAFDAAGNASNRAQAQGPATTSACSTGDTQAPTTPSAPAATGSTQSSISIGWGASIDNVAVAGYGIYDGATTVGSTTATSYTVSGLACGTSHTISVDAYDAAGNRSGKAQVTASTAACPPPSSAQYFLSPSGLDSSPCSQTQPCKSIDRAYRVASPGSTVELAAGSYPAQTINPDSSKTSSSDVLFRPAEGAAVSIGNLNVNGSHMELRDMTISQLNFSRSADDDTIRNVVNHGLWMQGSSNISIIGGEVTCGFCDYHSHIQNGGSDSAPPRNILFDGVYFHDWHSVSGEHTECLQILGGDNVTIRNSTFKNCATGNGGLGATADLHISFYGTGPVTRNILIEDNFFYPSGNMYAIQSGDYTNLDFRYNSIASPVLVGGGWGDGTPVEFVGNVMGFSGCSAPVTGTGPVAPFVWRYNVLSGGSCSSTDVNAPSGFVNSSSDLHLTAGSAAINRGDSSTYPSRDIDGQARPLGAAPDAGADERG